MPVMVLLRLSKDIIAEDPLEFGFQHHPRIVQEDLSQGTESISFFDNSAHSQFELDDRSKLLSSGKLIKVDNKHRTVELLQQFDLPANHRISAESQSSIQKLPSGNWFINWGSEGATTEYDSSANVHFHAKLESGPKGGFVQNYRGYKFPWIGKLIEDIAVATELVEGEVTRVYVSWNGDTDTNTWQVVDSVIGLSLKTFDKTGFENVIDLDRGFDKLL